MNIPDRDSEKEDYFNSEAPEKKPKEPKKEAPKPDDPIYWESDESEWEHLQPSRRRRMYIWLAVTGVAVGVIIAVWLKWFSPSIDDADMCGYVEGIQKEGLFFKTFEGTLLPYREIMDTTRVYREDFIFSVNDEKVAAQLKRMERKGIPVRVGYKKYRGTVPWRGNSRIEVVSVDSVDPHTLLPPDLRPEYDPAQKLHESPK